MKEVASPGPGFVLGIYWIDEYRSNKVVKKWESFFKNYYKTETEKYLSPFTNKGV